MREEILYLTHKKTEEIERQIRMIRDQMGDRSLTIVSDSVSFDIEGTNLFLFDQSIIQELDLPALSDSLVPGNVHFPVFSYIRNNKSGADYYWIIEYDVRFSGKWSVLFDHFKEYDEDMIASHITRYHQEPEWYWWDISHPDKFIPKEDRIRSFNPIYRISSEAHAFLEQTLKSGWEGHNETTFPTLLYHNGYGLLDFGGDSDFAAQRNRFYISRSDRWGNLYTGTMRYRPATKSEGFRKNKLYHPVKKDNGIGFFRFYIGNLYRLIKLWISKLNNAIRETQI